MPEGSLHEAVADAVNSNQGSGNNEQPGTGNVQGGENNKSAGTQQSNGSEQEIDPRTRDAKLLYEALENPTTQRGVVEELARRVGLNIQTSPTQNTSPAAATRNILDELKEGVAPEYHFLIDNLAPAIRKMVKSELDSGLQSVRSTLDEHKVKETEKEVNSAYEKIQTKYADFDALEPQMRELAKVMVMAPGADLETYLENLYKIASREKAEGNAVGKAVGKINKNAKEVLPASAEVAPQNVKMGSKLPTIDEAVKAAFRGERLID